MPRTKIICTIGPASQSPETIRALIKNGMNMARLNFSHGSLQGHGDFFVFAAAQAYVRNRRIR